MNTKIVTILPFALLISLFGACSGESTGQEAADLGVVYRSPT